MSSIQQTMHRLDRIQCVLARAVGILFGRQVGLEDRLQNQRCRCLAHSIAQTRNAQRPKLAIGLEQKYSSYRFRSIALLSEGLRQFPEPPLHPIRFHLRKALAVHPAAPLLARQQA